MRKKIKFWLISFLIITLTCMPNVFAANMSKVNTVLSTTITLNKTSDSLVAGQEETLGATITPENATNKSITWTSSNSAIASVDTLGKVKALKAGTVTITAATQDGSNLSASCEIKITQLATGVVLNKTVDSLVVGQVDTLKALVSPRDTTNKNIKWASSDPSIATVDTAGKVTAVKVGTATITATVDDGRNLHAPCTVHVTNLLTKKKKVDIVFTTGDDNSFNSDDFNSKVNSYVKNALANSGIDANIQSFSTSTISMADSNASDIFNKWKNYPDASGNWTYNAANNTIGSTANVSWTGYWDSSAQAQTTKDVNIEYDEMEELRSRDVGTLEYPNIICHPDPMGFTFRMTNNAGLYSYYAFEIYSYQGVAMLYRINNVPNPNNADNGILVAWKNTTHPTIASQGKYAKCLGFQNIDYNPSMPHHVKITANGRHIVVKYDNSSIFDVTDNDSNALLNGSYGPYTYSMPNACLKNITITKSSSKSFAEVLKEPTWRSNAKKFVVNLSNDALKDIATNSSTFPSTLATMLSNKSHFIGIMDNKDKPTVNNFISENDNLGTYIDNSDLDKALSSVTQYVLSSVNGEENNSNIFLVGDEINYSNYNSKDTDVVWSYSQDNKHLNYNNEFENCSKTGDIPLDNDLGISDFATGEWVHNKVSQFDKPGKYTISYKDKNGQVTTEIINIHRKPTPIFTAYAIANPSTGKFDVTIKDEDKSYDIDHENSDGTRRGIVNSKFQWKEVTNNVTDTWHDGKLPSGQAANKDFLVKLEVQDLEGQWSDPLVKCISTKNQNLAPIAQFTESTSEMPVDQLKSNASAGNDVVFTDESYDANGDSIREHWTVTDTSGNKIYDSSTMPTASTFIGKPLGTYNITLTCDDGPSPKFGTVLTSEPYTLQLKLVPINHKPTAHFKIDNTSKNPELIKITEDSTDTDGDSISAKTWIVTDSKGTIVEQTENKLPDLTSLNGTYTITLKVRDNPKIQPELWSDPYSQTVIVENSNPKK